ncbi:MAG TPA: protein kinase [Albitalea sp.]|uniref:serine/threonine protein kinase n=1 Tax=Piscinibacter sp. TaxID=1903157 RepID=UPI002ECFD6CF
MQLDERFAGADESVARAVSQRESLPAGTRLDDCEILRILGNGGFGTVYLAHDHSLDREVAIKEYLPVQLAYRAEGLRVAVRSAEFGAIYAAGLRSFVNEARILARFDHPAVVKVHRFWEANGSAYMVMPWVRGPTLREMRSAMRSPPTEAWLRGVLDPLLDALAMLHAQGIYHRDIAPDNILLPGEREPVLLDFGAARRVIGDRTQTITAVLKPSFAPIEQYAEASTLRQGPWTDLYALGAVVVYMLTAMPPPPSTVRSLQDEMPLLTLRPPPGVSASFLAAIQWALAVRPQDRPQSVQELCSAFDGLITPPRPMSIGVMGTGDEVDIEAPVPAPPLPRPMPEMAAAESIAFERATSRPWDPTIRLVSTPVLPVAPRRLPHWPRSPRSLVVAALGAVATVCGAALTLLNDARQPEPAAATWRALAQQAATFAGTAALPRPHVPPAAEPPVDAGEAAPTLKTVVLTPVARELPAAEPRLPAVMQAASTALRPPNKAAPPLKKRSAAAPVKLSSGWTRTGPREACADRTFFARGVCVQRKCEESRWRAHPQCVDLRRQRQERLARTERGA